MGCTAVDAKEAARRLLKKRRASHGIPPRWMDRRLAVVPIQKMLVRDDPSGYCRLPERVFCPFPAHTVGGELARVMDGTDRGRTEVGFEMSLGLRSGKGSSGFEVLSVPVQRLARCVTRHGRSWAELPLPRARPVGLSVSTQCPRRVEARRLLSGPASLTARTLLPAVH